MAEAVEDFTVAEAEPSTEVEALAAVGTTGVVAGSADITEAAMGATAGVLLAGTVAAGMAVIVADTVDTAGDRSVAAVAGTVIVAGDLVEHAARLAGCEAVRRCAARRHQDRGHLTAAEASITARPDGTRFREGAMQAACPRDPAVPGWRAGLVRAE